MTRVLTWKIPHCLQSGCASATLIKQARALQQGNGFTVESLTVLPGCNKNDEKEAFSVELKKGEVTAIVGPAGSGKSRLLADIESLAQEDTPTGRNTG